jgi:glycosyltransferase involved in cell wall biosynthesis
MKITIGLPFYNSVKTLEIAIKSVINQTFQNWELLLLDDGSNDGSTLIAMKYANSDYRIKLITDGKNKGLVARLNQIIEMANGELIARMDADDIMFPERLERQLEVFEQNPNIDIVASAVFTIDENDNPIGIRDDFQISLNDKLQIFTKSLLVHPTILVKKEWYISNRYDPNYLRAEDFELWCRTYKFTKFYRITTPLLLYREGNVNIQNYLMSMRTLRMILRKYSKENHFKSRLFIEIYKSYLKGMIYQFLGCFKMQYILSAKRNKTLTHNQKNSIENLISVLKKES